MDILELSIWFNFSSNWTTSNATCDDALAVRSSDREREFYLLGGFHQSVKEVCRQIQKADLNVENTSWIEINKLIMPAHLATTQMAVTIDHGRLYVFTGQRDYGCEPATRSSAYVDLLRKRWVNLPDVPEARYAPSVVIANRHVHLFGGVKSDRLTPSLDYWLLNLDDLARGWFSGPSMPQSGDHGHGVLIGEWIYSFGFEHVRSTVELNQTDQSNGTQLILCSGKPLLQPNVYKIQLNSSNQRSSGWVRLSDIPHPVSHASSILLNEQSMLLIGGGSEPVSHVELFNTHWNQWRSLSPLPVPMKNPLLWMNEEQSTLYVRSCSSSKPCLNYQTHVIWSRPPRTERCLFYTQLNCTTRQLRRTSLSQYDRGTESRWTRLFSKIYLLNMPKAVDRLRQAWSELNRMDLTSITLFEAFRVEHVEKIPILIDKNLIWQAKMQMWERNNDTKSARHYVLSSLSLKVIFMNLWTKNKGDDRESVATEPILILEDDFQFVRSKEETLPIVEKTLAFLRNHSEIEWDLLYLSYRNMKATRTHQISSEPSIALWRASQVLSTTAFIVNQNQRTIDRLNQCYFTRLDTVDFTISYCLEYQFLRAYLIEPRLVQAAPGFSIALNNFHDYGEKYDQEHTLGKHTLSATFQSSIE